MYNLFKKDKIYVINEGRIVECGRYEELMGLKNSYFSNMQTWIIEWSLNKWYFFNKCIYIIDVSIRFCRMMNLEWIKNVDSWWESV